MSTAMELEAYLYGALVATDHDHDVIDQALYERFVELGRDVPRDSPRPDVVATTDWWERNAAGRMPLPAA